MRWMRALCHGSDTRKALSTQAAVAHRAGPLLEGLVYEVCPIRTPCNHRVLGHATFDEVRPAGLGLGRPIPRLVGPQHQHQVGATLLEEQGRVVEPPLEHG